MLQNNAWWISEANEASQPGIGNGIDPLSWLVGLSGVLSIGGLVSVIKDHNESDDEDEEGNGSNMTVATVGNDDKSNAGENHDNNEQTSNGEYHLVDKVDTAGVSTSLVNNYSQFVVLPNEAFTYQRYDLFDAELLGNNYSVVDHTIAISQSESLLTCILQDVLQIKTAVVDNSLANSYQSNDNIDIYQTNVNIVERSNILYNHSSGKLYMFIFDPVL